MMPVPKRTNSLIFADNSVLFDKILVKFMGFDECRLTILKEAEKNHRLFGKILVEIQYVQIMSSFVEKYQN